MDWIKSKILDEKPVFSGIPELTGSPLMTCLISELDITLCIPTNIADLNLWTTITATKSSINRFPQSSMAPQIETIAPDPETHFLLSVLLNCRELNLDTQGLMETEGMSRKDKGVEKFRRILSKYGYKYENKQVLLMAENGIPTLQTSDKPASAKKAKEKGAPRAKKRKLDCEMAEEKGESE